MLIALDRRFKFGHGRMLALYVMAYTLGRGWIEMLRIDTVELDDVVGLRFNVWTSIVLFVLAAGVLPGEPAALARPGGVGLRRGPRRRTGAQRPYAVSTRGPADAARCGRDRGDHDPEIAPRSAPPTPLIG